MKVQLLVDNRHSWIVPYAKTLRDKLMALGHETTLVHAHDEVTAGDTLVLLSCEKIFRELSLNRFNLVVHESDLPNGKGWSPLTWQVLEGKREIPVTLIEAVQSVDAGKIIAMEWIYLDGTELINTLRAKQAEATATLILSFVENTQSFAGKDQVGKGTFYRKRVKEDSRLDPQKTLEEQFDLLRVVDNDRYPAFFEMRGKRYIIKIFEE